jgi:hypothetical protein
VTTWTDAVLDAQSADQAFTIAIGTLQTSSTMARTDSSGSV